MGSTPVTSTVMVPEKLLVFSVAPLPAKVLVELPPTDARPKELAAMPGKAVMAPVRVPDLSMELVLDCVALTFSTMATVRVSPTRRAR